MLLGSRDPNAKLTVVVPTGGRQSRGADRGEGAHHRGRGRRRALRGQPARRPRSPAARRPRRHPPAAGRVRGRRRPAGVGHDRPRRRADARRLPPLAAHRATPARSRADFAAAAAWLARLQEATAGPAEPVALAPTALSGIERRFPDHPALRGVRTGLSAVELPPSPPYAPRARSCTATTGPATSCCTGGRVSGVVDWESGALAGEPLRDVARFVLSATRSTSTGTPAPAGRVAGHRGLRAGAVRRRHRRRAERPGLVRRAAPGTSSAGAASGSACPAALWRDALLIAGIAEVAATADHPRLRRRAPRAARRAAGATSAARPAADAGPSAPRTSLARSGRRSRRDSAGARDPASGDRRSPSACSAAAAPGRARATPAWSTSACVLVMLVAALWAVRARRTRARCRTRCRSSLSRDRRRARPRRRRPAAAHRARPGPGHVPVRRGRPPSPPWAGPPQLLGTLFCRAWALQRGRLGRAAARRRSAGHHPG